MLLPFKGILYHFYYSTLLGMNLLGNPKKVVKKTPPGFLDPVGLNSTSGVPGKTPCSRWAGARTLTAQTGAKLLTVREGRSRDWRKICFRI